MVKFIEEDTLIGFREIPDEITLCVNISNCILGCKGCHSSYLAKNIGRELNFEAIDELIAKNDGITCFCFMGEGNDPKTLKELIYYTKEKYGDKIKVGLYSGRRESNEDWMWEILDYLKIGPYMEEYGPLDKETTNQRMYVHCGGEEKVILGEKTREGWKDITYEFWKRELN